MRSASITRSLRCSVNPAVPSEPVVSTPGSAAGLVEVVWVWTSTLVEHPKTAARVRKRAAVFWIGLRVDGSLLGVH